METHSGKFFSKTSLLSVFSSHIAVKNTSMFKMLWLLLEVNIKKHGYLSIKRLDSKMDRDIPLTIYQYGRIFHISVCNLWVCLFFFRCCQIGVKSSFSKHQFLTGRILLDIWLALIFRRRCLFLPVSPWRQVILTYSSYSQMFHALEISYSWEKGSTTGIHSPQVDQIIFLPWPLFLVTKWKVWRCLSHRLKPL